LRRDLAPLLRRYFSALHGPLITRSLAAVSLARYR